VGKRAVAGVFSDRFGPDLRRPKGFGRSGRASGYGPQAGEAVVNGSPAPGFGVHGLSMVQSKAAYPKAGGIRYSLLSGKASRNDFFNSF